jgi:putative membrane protein
MQTPATVPWSAHRKASQSQPSCAIAVFPLATPALVTAPVIAAIAAIIVINRRDPVHQAIVVALLLAVMAWIRTSLSLIAFGFGIGKVYEYLKSVGIRDTVDPIRSTLIFGSSFIGLGMLELVAAVIQHTRILQRLEAPDYAYNAMRPITVTVAIMLLMIGAFGLVGILL